MDANKQHVLQALSYYKIFGYPTGLGALLVHKRAVPLLMKRKRYFGGGTVAVSLAEEDFVRSLLSAIFPFFGFSFLGPLVVCNMGLLAADVISQNTVVFWFSMIWLATCRTTDCA